MHLSSRTHAARVVRSNASAPQRPVVASRITPVLAATTELKVKEGLLSREDGALKTEETWPITIHSSEPLNYTDETKHGNTHPDVDGKQVRPATPAWRLQIHEADPDTPASINHVTHRRLKISCKLSSVSWISPR